MILHPPEVPLGPPGVCLICRQSPDQRTIPIVNTMRHLDIGRPHPLSGTVFLCGDCVRTAMVQFNWNQPENFEALSKDYFDLQEELNIAEEKLLALGTLQEIQESVDKLKELGFKFTDVRTSETGTSSIRGDN